MLWQYLREQGAQTAGRKYLPELALRECGRIRKKKIGCAGKRVADPVLYQGFLEAEEKSGARLDGRKDAAGLKSIIIGENDLLYLFRDGRVWRTALQK